MGISNMQHAEVLMDNLPLRFVQNTGQLADDHVCFYAQEVGYGLFFTRQGVSYVFREQATEQAKILRIDLRFLNEGQSITPISQKQQEGKVSYFQGGVNPGAYQSLPLYEEIVYQEVWPGIDLVFKSVEGKLKYEFNVQVGAKVEEIRFTYEGVEELSLDSAGNLAIKTAFGELLDTAPISFQRIKNKEVEVDSQFILLEDNQVIGFTIGEAYDENYPLIIDPELVYSTFFTGSDYSNGINELRVSVVADNTGAVYIGGYTYPTVLPPSEGAFTPEEIDPDNEWTQYIFVTKMNPTGTKLLYTMYLSSDYNVMDFVKIAVDKEYNLYITGTCTADTFPVKQGSYRDDTRYEGDQAFAAKINAEGSDLLYATFLTDYSPGNVGESEGRGIAVDDDGCAYIVGIAVASEFTTTENAYQSLSKLEEMPDFTDDEQTYFLLKLNSQGSDTIYATFFNIGYPSGSDIVDVLVDSVGDAYLGGVTSNPYIFETTPDAYLNSVDDDGSGGGFVTKFNKEGTELEFSTYISEDPYIVVGGIALDDQGNVYVSSYSEETFESLVLKLNATGENADYEKNIGLGYINREEYNAPRIAVNSVGEASIIGIFLQENIDSIPLTPDALIKSTTTDPCGYLVCLEANSDVAYCTLIAGDGDGPEIKMYFGDIAVDEKKNVYVVGVQDGAETFPTTSGVYDSKIKESNRFLMKFGVPTSQTIKPMCPLDEHDTFCEEIVIRDNVTDYNVWYNADPTIVHGTVLVENRGVIGDWGADVTIQLANGLEKNLNVEPGESKATSMSNMLAINVVGRGSGVGETIVQITYILNS